MSAAAKSDRNSKSSSPEVTLVLVTARAGSHGRLRPQATRYSSWIRSRWLRPAAKPVEARGSAHHCPPDLLRPRKVVDRLVQVPGHRIDVLLAPLQPRLALPAPHLRPERLPVMRPAVGAPVH